MKIIIFILTFLFAFIIKQYGDESKEFGRLYNHLVIGVGTIEEKSIYREDNYGFRDDIKLLQFNSTLHPNNYDLSKMKNKIQQFSMGEVMGKESALYKVFQNQRSRLGLKEKDLTLLNSSSFCIKDNFHSYISYGTTALLTYQIDTNRIFLVILKKKMMVGGYDLKFLDITGEIFDCW